MSPTRLSALGTAHSWSVPTNDVVDVPEPLPKALDPAVGCSLLVAVPDDVAEVDVVVTGATGVSTGTFGCPFAAVDVLLLPVAALVPAAAPIDAKPALAAGAGDDPAGDAFAAGDGGLDKFAAPLVASGASATAAPPSLAMLDAPPDVAPPLVPV